MYLILMDSEIFFFKACYVPADIIFDLFESLFWQKVGHIQVDGTMLVYSTAIQVSNLRTIACNTSVLR